MVLFEFNTATKSSNATRTICTIYDENITGENAAPK